MARPTGTGIIPGRFDFGEASPKPIVRRHAGGRPPGAVTTNAPAIPGQLPGGTGQMTPLRKPAPSPSRMDREPQDRREAPQTAGMTPATVTPVEPKPRQGGEKKGQEDERAVMQDAIARGTVPGQSIEGEQGTAKPVFRMERNIRDPLELATAPAGVFQTPQGTLEKTPEGKMKVLDLSPEAKVKIQEIEAKEVERFGQFPGADDPAAPPPPVRAGLPWFNPFTGQWGSGGRDEEVSYLTES